MNATYDGIKAFEINSTYNDLANVADTLKEDVEAAIATFTGSLATSLGLSGYREDFIKQYIPAIVFTLYDGYYIYSPTKSTRTGQYEYTLKPYNYYTVRYKQKEKYNDVVINYTLDNYIVIYGWTNGKYIVKSGYLVSNTRNDIEKETINNVTAFMKNKDTTIKIDYNVEVTKDEYSPDYVNRLFEEGVEDKRDAVPYPRVEMFYINPEAATNYYSEAETFTYDVQKDLDWITPAYAMRNNTYLKENDEEFKDTTKVFNFNKNDPEDPNSIFSTHKTNVIKNSIQNNLAQAISEYSQGSESTYDFRLPDLKSTEWDMISSNIGMLTFFQGLPVGNKYYNNYSLVVSSTNKLYVSKENMYFITDDDEYYHKIDCDKLGTSGLVGFSAFDFEAKRVKKDDNYEYYYKHNHNSTTPKKACYYCIVSSDYQHKDIGDLDDDKQKAYYTALAREKYMRYTTTGLLRYEEK